MARDKMQGMAPLVAALAGLMLFTAGCNTREPQYVAAQVEVDNGTIELPVDGGEADVYVTSNRTWGVLIEGMESADKWLNTFPAPGLNASINGNGTLRIAAAANSGPAREAKVVIRASSATRVVTVAQRGVKAEIYVPPVEFLSPVKSGNLIMGEESQAGIIIPYNNGDGGVNPVMAEIVGGTAAAGLSLGTITPRTLTEANGNILIPLTGRPSTSGTVEVAIYGVALTGNNVVTFNVADPDDLYPAGPVATFTIPTSWPSFAADASVDFKDAGGNTIMTLSRQNPKGTLTYSSTSGLGSIYCSGWTATGACWHIDVPLVHTFYGTLSLSYIMWGSATAPRDWKIEFSADGGATWADADLPNTYSNSANLTASPGVAVSTTLTLKREEMMAAGAKLLIRMTPATTRSQRSGTGTYSVDEPYADSGNSRIAGTIAINKTQ